MNKIMMKQKKRMKLIKLNNKGQVLVLFVLLIPIFLIALIIGIEIVNLNIKKTKTINVIKETLSYGLNNYNEKINDKLNNLIDTNISYKEKNIFISESEIRIVITQDEKLFGRNIELKYNYKGIKQENIIIEEG